MVKKGKRPAPVSTTAPSKKRKLSPGTSNKKSSAQTTTKKVKPSGQSKGKDRAADRGIIPIPTSTGDDDEVELSDQDLDLLRTYGGAASFLNKLDEKGITRSKKETERLHALHKPSRPVVDDDLPSIDSHDEDEDDWSSGVDDLMSGSEDELGSEGFQDEDEDTDEGEVDSDEEMPYEKVPRIQRNKHEEDKKKKSIPGLPIKLADGRIQKTGTKVELPSDSESPSEEEKSESEEDHPPPPKVDDASTGARFGRLAVMDIIGNTSKKARLNGAKEQIANICQEIVSDPENSLGLLRRLHVFSLKEVTSPTHPVPIPNDPAIRKLAILSQLAVFKDIVPGYRIRPLTDKEKAEKVGQMVARTREWEQGLVNVYQAYLRSLEAELKERSELADLSLRCMCALLKEATHFNFRSNLMACLVTRLSRKCWDESSELCLQTIIQVFREDLTGEPSLEVVRLLNRMVKERKYNVRPEALSCLLHLRLKTELNVRASESRVDKPSAPSRSKAQAKRAKGKKTDLPHLSKKAKQVLKEKQEIDKEMREAEAEVDKEERANTQTETLKLVFVLYFSILKNSKPSPLLSAALQGISRFAHLINIDFFKDLMQVLKDLIARETTEEDQDDTLDSVVDIQQRLLCIVTAFELLTGQGEALNIDLSGFIKHLYAIILPLSLMPDIDTPPPSSSLSSSKKPSPTTAELLFRALNMAFSPRATAQQRAPTNRSAAFCKRLLVASLNWPPKVIHRTIELVLSLVARDPKLEGMLSTEDRMVGAVSYKWDVDDPEVVNVLGTGFCWEAELLRTGHWDASVREAATKLFEVGSGKSTSNR